MQDTQWCRKKKLEKVKEEDDNFKSKVTRLQNALKKISDEVSKLGSDLKSINSLTWTTSSYEIYQ